MRDFSQARRRHLKTLGASAGLLLPGAAAFAAVSTSPVPWQQAGPVYPYPNPYLIIPNLGTWLVNHPTIRDALRWESTAGTVLSYGSWGTRAQAALNDAYVNAYRGYSTGLPLVPDNILSPPHIETVLSTSDAWLFYLHHVAHSLAVEIRGDVPWSVTQMTAKELAIIFDSRQYFAWMPDLGGYKVDGQWGGGYSTPAPPDYVYGFLQANSIPNFDHLPAGQTSSTVLYDAKSKAMARLMAWCGDKLTHFQGWTDNDNLYAHLQYYGCPPVARVLQGTINPSYSSTLRHFTAGCFGTTGFLQNVARTMNIAVEPRYLPPLGHTTPYVFALDAWLSHGDDLYNSFGNFSEQAVGTALSFPRQLLFIDTPTHDAWFGPGLTPAQQDANVGRRLLEVAQAYLPIGLLNAYIFDLEKGHTHANGQVAANFSDVYSLAQLDALNLWARMDGKIALQGGAQVVKAKFDQATTLQQT